MTHPNVVCICGSTRFLAELNAARRKETLAGKIVVSSEVYFKDDPDLERLGTEEADALKAKMDELHLRKIDLADEVFFLNVANYWGASTTRELEYAVANGKLIRFLEDCAPWHAKSGDSNPCPACPEWIYT